MSKRPGYSPEVRERAVRLVLTSEHDHSSRWAATQSVAAKIGCTPETLRTWINKIEVDSGANFYVLLNIRKKYNKRDHMNKPTLLLFIFITSFFTACVSKTSGVTSGLRPSGPIECKSNRSMNTYVEAPNVDAIPINRDRIFCGVVSTNWSTPKAMGIKSMPNGLFPKTIRPTQPQEPHEFNQIYTLKNAQVTHNHSTAIKSESTMYPDSCSASQVLNSIAHAYNSSGIRKGDRMGIGESAPISEEKSGHYCLAEGNIFSIKVFLSHGRFKVNDSIKETDVIVTGAPQR